MSTGAILTFALLGVAGSLLVARWLWRPPGWLRKLGRLLSGRVGLASNFPDLPPPDDPVDRTIYETFEDLGVESEARRSSAVAETECLPLEAIFPTTTAAEPTEYLTLDPRTLTESEFGR
ncbi:hypothetical protein ACNOYE_00560 [Nannocystaceae bacterium ST9]